MATRIQILVEDKNFKPELEGEHGLSMLVEGEGIRFIFDCGQTGMAWRNAEKLGVDLTKIKTAVISHAHYDHGGGFTELLKYARIKTLYTGEKFFDKKFSWDGTKYVFKGVRLTTQDLERLHITNKICGEMVQLDEKIFLVGKFNRTYEFETVPDKFFIGRAKKKLPDDFGDEICMAIRGDDGLSVVAACSHVGILNIVSTVAERFNEPVTRLVGGVHLLNADDERIDKTIAELKNLGVRDFKLCHCSGENVCAKVNSETLSTGSVIEL